MALPLVALADVYAFLGIPNGTRDAQMIPFHEGVEDAIMDFCETNFQDNTVTNEVHDGERMDTITPRNYPIISVQAVRMGTEPNGTGGSTIATSDFTVYPWGIVFPRHVIPKGRSYVGIDYHHGYTAVPKTVQLAVKLGVEAWLRRFDKKTLGEGGVQSQSKDRESVTFGTSSGGSTKWDDKTGLPKEVVAMISKYRHLEFPGGETASRNF